MDLGSVCKPFVWFWGGMPLGTSTCLICPSCTCAVVPIESLLVNISLWQSGIVCIVGCGFLQLLASVEPQLQLSAGCCLKC